LIADLACGVPQRNEPTPPRDAHQIIDEQARRIAQLEEDLRRSEAERSDCGAKMRN
jgi:hypothetical protein